MTKPRSIVIFKKELSVSMDINKSFENFDPNAKIAEIFVDIEFDAYDDPQKKNNNEVFPCI